jgi:hypothetical protein
LPTAQLFLKLPYPGLISLPGSLGVPASYRLGVGAGFRIPAGGGLGVGAGFRVPAGGLL